MGKTGYSEEIKYFLGKRYIQTQNLLSERMWEFDPPRGHH